MTLYINTPNHGTLNMREKPDTKSFILKKIPDRTPVEGELEGDWTQIKYQGEVGYVMTKFLSKEAQSESITKEDLQKIRDGLQNVLKTIEQILVR